MQTLIQDLRYSLRQLIKSPAFSIAAIFSLALGIGATTAVFSVIYAALVNPYPYPTADRIVRLTVTTNASADQQMDLNGLQIAELRRTHSVAAVLAMDYHALTLTGGDLPENVDEIGLISNGFNDLAVPPILGRGILPSDAMEGQDPQAVAVLSYKFWQKHFHGDPAAVGQTLQLDHKSYRIVGVAAPRFVWYSADVYLPLKLTLEPNQTCIIDMLLQPGVSHEAADAELQPLLERFAHDTPKQFPHHFKVHVEGLNEWVVKTIGKTLYLLFGAVAVILIIGCGNVSILLLARGTTRQHELAVRSAVGAGRSRVLRQLLTESLLLSALGAALGVLMAYGILAGIRVLLPRFAFAPEVVIQINLPVLAFSIAAALVTGILFGLWPALQLSRPQISQLMQSGARRTTGKSGSRRTHDLLIVGQISLTLLLLVGAGSAIAAFTRMMHAPMGFDPQNVLAIGVPIHENAHPTWQERAAYIDQLRNKVAETPGVIMTAVSSNATPPTIGWTEGFEILGKNEAEPQYAGVNFVGSGYFTALRVPLVSGRVWSETENRNGGHVAVINRVMERRYFPNGSAVGHAIKLPDIQDKPPLILSAPEIASAWLQVVGVVEDFRDDGLKNPVRPAIFVPYTLSMAQATQLLVRTQVPPMALLPTLRARIASIDPDQQVYDNAEDLNSLIVEQPEWQQQHLVSWIFGVFAFLALTLAAVGLYSVVSYTVMQRTNEFGLRMALGAQPLHVLRIVVRSISISVGTGMVVGLLLTLALNKVIEQWVDGSTTNPSVMLTGIVLLSLVAGIACAMPARRACRIDPMIALRFE